MNVNERLADEAVSHAVDLQQYTTGVVRRIIALLNRSDAGLEARLNDALLQATSTQTTIERLESLLISVRELNAQAYAAIGRELTAELRELVAYEAGYQLQLFQATIPAQVQASVAIVAVNAEQVYAAALSRPFQGRLLREWAAGIEAGRMQRIRDEVRMGFIEQEPIQQIVRRIKGTRAKGYSDGIIDIDRRHVETIVRTAVSHTAAFTRERFFDANADIIKAQAWNATLDTRTSEICRPRDGKQYEPVSPYKPIGHSFPWLGGPGRAHMNCRSAAVPITKSWRELGIDLDEMSPTERASMDGTVPAQQDYAQWLRKQSAARQDQVLGPERGKLFRAGGLELDRFYTSNGRYLSLPELRERDAAAFKRAGL